MEFKQIVKANVDQATRSKKKRKSYVSTKRQADFVSLWEESQISQTEFCRQHDINLKTFSNWRKKTNEQHALSASRLNKPGKAPSRQSRHCYEIVFPNGIKLYVIDSVEKSLLSLIIKEIHACKSN